MVEIESWQTSESENEHSKMKISARLLIKLLRPAHAIKPCHPSFIHPTPYLLLKQAYKPEPPTCWNPDLPKTQPVEAL